jgi:hypothetical protein
MQVHFVGSVGLDTAEEVFAAVGDAVKPRRGTRLRARSQLA